MAEKDTSTVLIFKTILRGDRMAQWLQDRTFVAGGSWNAGSNPGMASCIFFWLFTVYSHC